MILKSTIYKSYNSKVKVEPKRNRKEDTSIFFASSRNGLQLNIFA